MGNVFYFEWEITLMEWLQGHSNKLMEILAWFFTQFGEEMVLVGLFLIINSALKLPFDKDFLNTAAFLPFMLRICRYAVASFVILGVYPMSFAYLERILNKRSKHR